MNEATHGESSNAAAQKLENLVRSTRAEIGDLDTRTRDLVRDRPLIALIGAIGIGYLVARLSARI